MKPSKDKKEKEEEEEEEKEEEEEGEEGEEEEEEEEEKEGIILVTDSKPLTLLGLKWGFLRQEGMNQEVSN